MSDLQWKIEDDCLFVRYGGEWHVPMSHESADVVLAVIAATQEKCAQVLSARAHWERSAYGNTDGAELLDWGASAVRALKMETGHAGT